MSEPNLNIAVVGGGPGGYAAAFLAADLGMTVTLVDPELNPGGVCLYRGCIPSKALLHVSKLLAESRQAADWGIKFAEPAIDLGKLRSWKDAVVRKLTGGLGQLSKQRAVNYVRGYAAFIDANNLSIRKTEGGEERLSFEHAIIATGSRPATIPGFPQESARVLDSTSALELADVPQTMLVIGGGYIGLELGTVYAALGSRVSVVEMMPGLLPGADRDLVNVLAKRVDTMCEHVYLSTKVVALREEAGGLHVTLENENLERREE